MLDHGCLLRLHYRVIHRNNVNNLRNVPVIRGEGGGVDIPVPADYDGDRRAELAVYQPTRALWATRNIVTGAESSITWGIAGTDDLPIVGDFDGDGISDRTIYRRSTAQWITRFSSGQPPIAITWGEAASRDYPIPAADFDLNFRPYY